MRLTLTTFLTLDGVMQAPGGADEDPEGFRYGGWQAPFGDEDMMRLVTDWMANADAFLLGRKTYEIFAGYWPRVTDDNDRIAVPLNRLPKYVASTTLRSLQWNNSHLVRGDVVAEVRRLKAQPGNELQVHGSGQLAQTLIAHDLVDEYRLWIYPVLVGAGKRLFRERENGATLRLIASKTTSTGVLVCTYYRPAGPIRSGSHGVEEGRATQRSEP
ncbi:MAG: dihydrofolate reductase [Candidatus Dormibacteraeota bacterium]|nr:dihydrofolate reductase [Candidatus Dormibacteraeota bacterium]